MIIAIDFDGVVHKYSKGWKGEDEVYDPPNEGAIEALTDLKNKGHRLVIFSCRPVKPIWKWLKEHKIDNLISRVTNTKPIAKIYIDDRGYKFNSWEQTMSDLFTE